MRVQAADTAVAQLCPKPPGFSPTASDNAQRGVQKLQDGGEPLSTSWHLSSKGWGSTFPLPAQQGHLLKPICIPERCCAQAAARSPRQGVQLLKDEGPSYFYIQFL